MQRKTSRHPSGDVRSSLLTDVISLVGRSPTGRRRVRLICSSLPCRPDAAMRRSRHAHLLCIILNIPMIATQGRQLVEDAVTGCRTVRSRKAVQAATYKADEVPTILCLELPVRCVYTCFQGGIMVLAALSPLLHPAACVRDRAKTRICLGTCPA
jgi:hypothetical protein